jgi:hypothetical protein
VIYPYIPVFPAFRAFLSFSYDFPTIFAIPAIFVNSEPFYLHFINTITNTIIA